jgi:hypothetical protein
VLVCVEPASAGVAGVAWQAELVDRPASVGGNGVAKTSHRIECTTYSREMSYQSTNTRPVGSLSMLSSPRVNFGGVLVEHASFQNCIVVRHAISSLLGKSLCRPANRGRAVVSLS